MTATPAPGHERYAQWDAAYVLGALSAAERREFETHIAECEVCAAAVADLAALPGLLSALPATDALVLVTEGDTRAGDTGGDADADSAGAAARATADDGIPSTVLAGVTRRVHRLRRHRRRVTAGIIALAAAVAVAVAGIVLPIALQTQSPSAVSPPFPSSAVQPTAAPSVAVALDPVTPSALSATVSLTDAAWGTHIDVTCTYSTEAASPGAYATTGRYALYVTDAAGASTRVSSWSAGPGSTVTTTGSIDTPVSGIRSLELRSIDTNTVLLSHNIG